MYIFFWNYCGLDLVVMMWLLFVGDMFKVLLLDGSGDDDDDLFVCGGWLVILREVGVCFLFLFWNVVGIEVFIVEEYFFISLV